MNRLGLINNRTLNVNTNLILNRINFVNTNGWLDTRDNSTISVTNNAIRSTGLSNNTSGTSIAFKTIIGEIYRFSISVEKSNGDTMYVRVGDQQILSTYVYDNSETANTLTINNASFTAISTTSYIGVICVNRDTGQWVQVKSVSVKKQ